MRQSAVTRYRGLVLSLALVGMATTASAQGPAAKPPYMGVIVGQGAATKTQVAHDNVLALNVAMFGYYDRALNFYQQRLLVQHPVILALFSGAGGDFTLYRPGMAPLRAPSVPIAYQLLKSVGHSSMALFQIAGPYLDNAGDQSWRALMEVDRTQHKVALDTLADVDMDPSWRDNSRIVLLNNVAFMDAALAKGVITYADLSAFAKKQAPYSGMAFDFTVGGRDPGGALDGRRREVEADARNGLAEDVRGEQLDLRRATKQRHLQRPRPVLRAGCHELAVDAVRDNGLHHDPGGNARRAHPSHCRSIRRSGVLWQLLLDGL